MPLTAEQKTQAVDHLVTNCDCWKGKADVLNGLTDEQLVDIYNAKVILAQADDVFAAVRDVTGNADLTVNAMAGAVKGMKKKPKAGCAEPDEDDATTNTPIEARLTPEEREAVENALAVTAAEKEQLVARLVANVSDESLKARLTAVHAKKPLAQLRDEAAALPVPTANRTTPSDDRFRDLRPAPIYIGAAGSAASPTAPKKAAPIPTVNIDWSKPVARTPNTPTGTPTA